MKAAVMGAEIGGFLLADETEMIVKEAILGSSVGTVGSRSIIHASATWLATTRVQAAAGLRISRGVKRESHVSSIAIGI